MIFGPIADAIKDKFDSLFNENSMRYISWANSASAYDYFAIADLVVFPGRHSVYWEQAAGQGKPMLCKYWEGTTHVDCGGNVKFLTEDSAEEMKNLIASLSEKDDRYNRMLAISDENAKNKFSYKVIARKSIDEE